MKRNEWGIFLCWSMKIREKVMDQFMISLEDLNAKVEENSKANAALLEENRYLREEYQEKIGKYQEQAKTSKEIISKLSEMNVLKFYINWKNRVYMKIK